MVTGFAVPEKLVILFPSLTYLWKRKYVLFTRLAEAGLIGVEEEDGTFSTYTIRDRMAGIKLTILHFDDPRKLLLSPALSCLVGPSFKASQPSNYNDMCDDLQRCLDFRASAYCRDMIKHKKLNDANNIFNRMV